MSDYNESAFVMAALPDSEDARLFVELSSFGADLEEAAGALELEVESRIEGSTLERAQSHLLGMAAIAYARAFAQSNVRGRLQDHIAIPLRFEEAHKRIIGFRNTTVAHSQSRLATTYALAVFDRSPLRFRYVSAATVKNMVPAETIAEFQDLIFVVDELLESCIAPVRQRLADLARNTYTQQLLAESESANVVDKTAAEFSAQTKRDRYPDSHDFYWSSSSPA